MRYLLVLSWLFGCTPWAIAEEVQLPQRERFHLYLLIGQSNMAGRGAIADNDPPPHPRVLKLDAGGKWTAATDPLHFDKSIAGVGLGSSFGPALAEAHPDATIGLIPCAVGGTRLERWQKGADLYEQALVRARQAMRDGTLKGILWHQGEGDASDEKLAASYGDRLVQMVADLRADLQANDVPFVAGKLADFLPAERMPYVAVVNQQLDTLPERLPNCYVVDARGLEHKGDQVHFNSSSYRELGRRYAAKLLPAKP